jgi:hypothetical protein
MDLYSSIFTRASTRKFDPTPLSADTLKQIEGFIKSVKPLLPNSKFTHKIVGRDEVKGLGVPNAPHFLLISGASQPLKNTAAGYLYQHAELFMYSIGLATRWLGSTKGKTADPNHIISIAFGEPQTPTYRKPEDFDRKPLNQISAGSDSRIEAVRFAPSGVNAQPWYFIAKNNNIYVYYKKKLSGLMGLAYKMTDLDVGIALAHLDVASGHEGKDFNFTIDKNATPTAPEGYEYIGTAK